MKLVIIINGKGGCGKDALCEIAGKRFNIRNVSAITPVRNAAYQLGYHGGKSEKDRKFLSDLEDLVIAYNGCTTTYLLKEYDSFMESLLEEIMFVHIRKGEEIDKFKDKISARCITLLVERDTGIDVYHNRADDDVNNYNYDYVFHAPGMEELESTFISFLDNIIEEVYLSNE